MPMLIIELMLSFLLMSTTLVKPTGSIVDKMVGEWRWDNHPQSPIWILKSASGYTFSVVDAIVRDPAIFDANSGTLTAQLTNGRKAVIIYLPQSDKLEIKQIGGGDSDLGQFSRYRK